MYEIAGVRDRTILSLAKDFGLRVGDFSGLLKEDFESRIDKKAPVPIRIITHKEGIVAHSFISKESIEQLKLYLPTLNPRNKYLWPSSRRGHLSEGSINRIIKNSPRRRNRN